MNQIAIFEQYLKVAVLQHKARQNEQERTFRSRGDSINIRSGSLDIEDTEGKTDNFFLFDKDHVTFEEEGE